MPRKASAKINSVICWAGIPRGEEIIIVTYLIWFTMRDRTSARWVQGHATCCVMTKDWVKTGCNWRFAYVKELRNNWTSGRIWVMSLGFFDLMQVSKNFFQAEIFEISVLRTLLTNEKINMQFFPFFCLFFTLRILHNYLFLSLLCGLPEFIRLLHCLLFRIWMVNFLFLTLF